MEGTEVAPEIVKGQLQELEKQNEALKEECSKHRMARLEAEKSLNTQNARANKAEAEVARLKKVGPADKVEKELEGLRKQVGTLHSVNAELEKSLDGKLEEIANLNKKILALNREKDLIGSTVAQIQSARDAAQKRVQEALGDTVQKAAEVEKLKDEVKSLTQRVKEFERTEKEERRNQAGKNAHYEAGDSGGPPGLQQLPSPVP